MKAEMKKVPGFPGYYCTRDGRVLSNLKKWHELKGQPDKNGYLKVTLYKAGKAHYFRIHRIVMLTYAGQSSLMINHINSDRTDNSFGNLEYCTERENQSHRRLMEGKNVGCCWDARKQKWRAYFQNARKWFHLGLFNTKEQAKEAYIQKLKEEHITNKYAIQ